MFLFFPFSQRYQRHQRSQSQSTTPVPTAQAIFIEKTGTPETTEQLLTSTWRIFHCLGHFPPTLCFVHRLEAIVTVFI